MLEDASPCDRTGLVTVIDDERLSALTVIDFQRLCVILRPMRWQLATPRHAKPRRAVLIITYFFTCGWMSECFAGFGFWNDAVFSVFCQP